MPSKRAVARTGSRLLGGLLGLTVAVVAVGAATLVPWPTATTTSASVVVAPLPSEQKRVCPGPLLTLAEDATSAEAATSIGPAAAVYGAAPGAAEPEPVTQVASLAAGDNARSDRDGSPLLLSVAATAGSTVPSLVAGSQSQTAAAETVGGFAAAACGEASTDAWLVGGSTDIGRTGLVLLSNPTTVVASVDLTVFGESGVVDAPGATGILVQPGAQRIVSLAGLAPNLQSPVVHVQSHGGQVAASLEQSLIQGIEPGGVELVGPSAGPSPDQVIAGLVVTEQPEAASESDAETVSDAVPSVRVLAPDDRPTAVEVVVSDANGIAASFNVDVPAGIASEVPLPGLAPGNYSVRLDADQPIVAAARASAVGSAGKDFAWFTASAPLPGDFMVSVASGPAPTLHLVNTEQGDAAVTVTSDTGTSVDITVAPAGQATLDLVPGARYVVAGGSSIVAAVSYSGAGLISGFTLSPAGPLAAPIRVYTH